jgi:hypothetical protein
VLVSRYCPIFITVCLSTTMLASFLSQYVSIAFYSYALLPLQCILIETLFSGIIQSVVKVVNIISTNLFNPQVQYRTELGIGYVFDGKGHIISAFMYYQMPQRLIRREPINTPLHNTNVIRDETPQSSL